MKPGEVLYRGRTKKGREIVIRYPTKTDGPELMRYLNVLSCERSFILFQGEQVTLKEEMKYLKAVLQGMAKKTRIVLLVFLGDLLVGVTGVEMKQKAEKHVGSFGISIAKGFRGEGIGKLLMDLALKEAKKNLSDLKIVTLGVFGDNDIAHPMYRKYGFVEFGTLPGGIRHNSSFVDHIFMYKNME